MEIKKNNLLHKNLVNAKSTIIGKIRSIKLIKLLDNLKEEIAIAEKLAALVRISDITDLRYSNKRINRKINSFKYLNKKKISKLNRIKILHTIKSINKDLNFERKLDSNFSSKLPITLLYYSNLKPANKRRKIVKKTTIMQINKSKGLHQKNKIISPVIKNSNLYNNYFNLDKDNHNPPVLSAYLRELSLFNRETKGIMNYYSRIIGYSFNYSTNKISSSVYELLAAAFYSMRCLISRPVFVFTPDKVSIKLFYFLLTMRKKNLKRIKRKMKSLSRYPSPYRNQLLIRMKETYNKKRLKVIKKFEINSLKKIFPKRLKFLCRILNKIFNKPVELKLTRLYYPSADSNILVNFMGICINKIKLPKILKKLFKGSIIKTLIKIKSQKYNDISIIPAFLTGLSIRVAGRIMTQRAKPRKTINFRRRGITAKGKINYLNFARLTLKNKRGSHSITISAGQNYFK